MKKLNFEMGKKKPEPKHLAKEILLDELNEQAHPERVEDVLFWALEYYCENSKKGTWGETIAFSIKQRILDAEKDYTSTHEKII